MKSKLILALAALSVTNSAFGKGEEMVTGSISFDNKFPHFINAPNRNSANTKPLRLVSRVFAWYDGSSFVAKDSITYRFSDVRGGVPDVDDPMEDEGILFDESIRYSNRNGTGIQAVLRRKQTYNADNKVHILTYGSWRNTSSIWYDSLRYVYKYENDKMVESGLEIPFNGNGWTTHVTSLMVYNGNKVVEMNATNYKMKFEYDGTDNLVLFTDTQWDQAASAWVNKERSRYTYTANNEVASHEKEMWDATSGRWKYVRRTEYTYTGSEVATSTEYYYNQGWQRDVRHLFAYNNNLNKDIETIQTWNPTTQTFINSKQVLYGYNHLAMPLSITGYTWDGNTATWVHTNGDEQYRYYYEAVFPTSVAQTELSPNTLNIYPVPAAGNVNLDINFESPEQAHVALSDVKGTVVRQWLEAPATALHKQLDMSSVPAGNYVVTVTTARQKLTGRVVIAR